MRGSAKRGALVVLAAVVVAAAAFASSAQGVHPSAAPAAPTGCQLGHNGKIKHVIYLQFDNVHFNRDNPNVPSDLEQMPHLLNFLKDNGTFDTNDHTILISHTGGGILSSLTGLYPNRHGQAVSNSYGYFRPDGSVGFSSSFKYWTDNTDGGNAATTPPTPSADTNYNMVNNDPASLGGNNGAVRNAPGPWVPFTRAGCDVGGAGLANIELENNTAISFAAGPTATTAAASAGATSIAVANRGGFSAGMAISIDAESNLESATIASIVPGSGNAGTFNLAAPLTKSHATNVTVYGPTAPDPTGDMTKVFGVGSPQWNEGQRSQKANPGTALRNLAQTDFVGYAIHCGNDPTSICTGNSSAVPDPLPDEALPGGGGTNGYQGFMGLFGSQAVNPAINHGTQCIGNVDDTGNVADQFGQCGFPGFDGLFPKNTLAEVAKMQEAGVPVTFGYLSDAHDGHGVAGEIHHAYGPGEAGYVQQLHDYDQSFANFFTRMKDDGITKKNTLFVVTVEEGDHFAGTQPNGPCDGVTTACTYGNVSEVNADLKRMVATYNASHGTTATTNFSVHSDMAPNVYITGNPATGSPTARTLEKAMSDMSVTNPYSGQQQKLFVAMADPVEEKLLHMVTADPARTPTFTPFAQGDYFLSASSTTPCAGNDLNACLTTAVSNPNQSFAWNHGGVQPEVRSTWIGWVGPGVEKKGETDSVWTDHTDIRPTMLTLLGLNNDDYVSDGRVVTEFLKGDATPKSLDAHKKTVEDLGAMWKQLNASFGQFSMDTLCASTAALASNTSGDTTYSQTESALESLGAQRDTLADKIRLALWDAEFNGQAINEKQAKNWIEQGQGYLDQASALCGQFSSASSSKDLDKIKHFVVIYEENHSFDNLFGGWEGVNGRNNVHKTGIGDHVTQVDQNGVAYNCLKQLDVNLSSDPSLAGLPADCTDSTHGFSSHFPNTWFGFDPYIGPTDITCPPITNAFAYPNGILKQGLDPTTHNPVPGARAGGCTRDLVHEYYQEQYQLHGGSQDRYMSGSDSAGTTMGVYDTKQLPLYEYLHSKGAPHYAIDDNFFQAAFGGSFLNHQWLIAAATPVDPTGSSGGAHAGSHSIIDSNGMPVAYPLYSPTGPVQRNPLTVSCPAPAAANVCGNWAVNTMQPAVNPQGAFSQILPLQTAPTIGDRLTAAGIDWAWYSGGWANANGDTLDPGYTNTYAPSVLPSHCSDPNVDPGVRAGVPVASYPRCPDALFQYHHQPFNYYANYAPGTPGRAHLQDEADFNALADSSTKDCELLPVSFVKPIGEENEHPGYASEPNGSDHLVNLLKSIENSKCAKDTMVIVTYDEFGGQWDHVSPPGQGNNNGPHDVWGPGTRIPALILAPHLKGDFVVDSAEHDTTSILATIEHRYGLAPLGSRDAAVNDLATAFDAKKP